MSTKNCIEAHSLYSVRKIQLFCYVEGYLAAKPSASVHVAIRSYLHKMGYEEDDYPFSTAKSNYYEVLNMAPDGPGKITNKYLTLDAVGKAVSNITVDLEDIKHKIKDMA